MGAPVSKSRNKVEQQKIECEIEPRSERMIDHTSKVKKCEVNCMFLYLYVLLFDKIYYYIRNLLRGMKKGEVNCIYFYVFLLYS